MSVLEDQSFDEFVQNTLEVPNSSDLLFNNNFPFLYLKFGS